jgi:hypothetical protein
MASLYSDIGTKQNNPTPKNTASNAEITPATKLLNPTYTFTAAELSGDQMFLVYVPKGTKVFSTRGKVRSDAVATAITLDVGYVLDDGTTDINAFATLLDVAAAGTDAFDEELTYEFTDAGWIIGTITGTLTTPVAAKTLEFEIAVNYPN